MAIRLPGQAAPAPAHPHDAAANPAAGALDAASSMSSGTASLPDVTAFSALARRALTDSLDRVRPLLSFRLQHSESSN